LAGHEDKVRVLVAEKPDITITELCRKIAALGIKVGRSALARFLPQSPALAAFCGLRACGPPPPAAGSCQASSSLGGSVMVLGTNVVAYVPKGAWDKSTTGVSAINIEGTSITPKLIENPLRFDPIGKCARIPSTREAGGGEMGETVELVLR
jgi:hypothetical protein